jgi:hypothetical protein
VVHAASLLAQVASSVRSWLQSGGAGSIELTSPITAVGASGNAVVVLTGSDGAYEQAETNSWLDAAIVPFGQSTYVADFRETQRYYDNGPASND